MSAEGTLDGGELELPVMVTVAGADGRVERVRVGTALRCEQGLLLKLAELSIATPAPAPAPKPVEVPLPLRWRAVASHTSSLTDLEYLANRSRQTLADPAKERWHSEAREQLMRIEEEMARQRARLISASESASP
ncbi:MAG: hypothetical protein ACYC8T_02465 [Myxococcaceae bacterium]